MKEFRYHKTEVFCKTRDDWYPNFPGNKVQVSLHVNFKPPGEEGYVHRVCAWGDDDFGMDIEFRPTTREEVSPLRKKAEELFKKVCALKSVDKEVLKEMGFVSA